MKEVYVSEENAKKVRNGFKFEWEKLVLKDRSSVVHEDYLKIITKDSLVAVLEVNPPNQENEGWKVKKIRVFN